MSQAGWSQARHTPDTKEIWFLGCWRFAAAFTFPRETTCHLCWGTLAFVHLLLFVTPYLGPVFLTPSCHSLLLGLSPVLILPRLTSSRILWTQLHLLPFHGQSPHSPPTPISSSGPNWNWFPTARLIESEHMKISLQHETFQYLHRSLSRISFSCVYSPDHQNREVEHHQKPPSWVQVPEYSLLQYLWASICPQGSHARLSGALLRSTHLMSTTVLYTTVLMPLQATRMPKIPPGGYEMVC